MCAPSRADASTGGRRETRFSLGPRWVDTGVMADLQRILSIEVPVIVRLGECQMTVKDVLDLVPGSIIELQKDSDAELDLLVNNKQIGFGVAVKVGENFGLRVTYVGDIRERIEAMGLSAEDGEASAESPELDALAEAMLGGHL